MLVAIPEAPETTTTVTSSTIPSHVQSTGSPGHVKVTGSPSPPMVATTISPLHKVLHSSQDVGMDVDPPNLSSSRVILITSKFSEIREDGDPNSSVGNLNSLLLRRQVSVPPGGPSSTETNSSNSISGGGTVSNGLVPTNFPPVMDPIIQDHSFQQQLLQLKHEQELQHQLLLQRYQAQRQQLAQVHEKQLQQRLKEFWENKRRQDEERDRLEALKKKEKHEQSAVASSEVKQKLQGFLLNKKQREAAASSSNFNSNTTSLNSNTTNGSGGSSGVSSGPVSIPSNTNQSSIPSGMNASPPFGSRTWSAVQAARLVASGQSSTNPDCMDSSIPPSTFPSHPYRRHPFIPKFEEDFPLRKTASEPNLLKMRLKQRVLDRRSSPLVRRKEKSTHLKRRSYLATEGSGSAGSTPDSGPNSPPINGMVGSTPRSGSGERTPQHEDGSSGGGGGSPYSNSVYGPPNSASVTDLTLYSSPSLPNISLGKPLSHTAEGKLAAVSETEVRCPIPAPPHPVPIPLLPFPYYGQPHAPPPSLDAAGLEALYQSSGLMALYQAQQAQQVAAAVAAQQVVVAEQEASRRDPRRPLGRTQSAPLPLGHPMLLLNAAAAAGGAPGLVNGLVNLNQAGSGPGGPVLDPQQAHQLLRQHIRQTVLTRAGSRGQVIGSLNRTVSVEEDSAGEGEAENETAIALEQQHRYSAKVHRHPISNGEPQDLSTGGSSGPINSTSIPAPVASSVPHRLQHLQHGPRPLSRALSSPLVALGAISNTTGEIHSIPGSASKGHGTGLAFDNLMLKHQCLCGDNSQHPEHPGRLQSIWARLQETGLINLCERLRTRKATLEEIQSCHSEAHTLLFGTNPLSRQRMELSRFPESSLPIKSLVRLPCNGIGIDSDTAWNELHTPSAARMAVGCVLDLSFRVATGDLRNGFAICRPPGHHAEPIQAMGFCFFNNIAIAARQLRTQLQLEKILLVDWDVHHGNGTQQIFYDDPHVLYLSIHRHDEGNFFPGTGGPTECGIEDGMGFTVNIGWGGSLNPPMGDAEYLAAFRSIIMPIAQDFQPDIVLVSCGFDAANGHAPPLGGYRVSPACFGWMTQQLMTLAGGKVVLALEGGYDLTAICDSAQECVKALLGEPVTPISEDELIRPPCAPAIDTLLRTLAVQTPHWPCIKRYSSLIQCSALDASLAGHSRRSPYDRVEESETVSAMASLSMRYHSPADPGTKPGSQEVSVRLKTARRRSCDIMTSENSGDGPPADLRSRRDNEEPMDQDDGK